MAPNEKLVQIRPGFYLEVFDSGPKQNSKIELVFVHGIAGGTATWKPQIKYFSDKYRVIAYHLSGFGESSRRKDYCIEDHVQDLYDLVHTLDLKNPVFIGHSYGSTILQVYAKEHPVKYMILVATGTHHLSVPFQRWLLFLPKFIIRWFAHTKIGERIILYYVTSDNTSWELKHELYSAHLPDDFHFIDAVKNVKYFNSWHWAKDITAKTGIVLGEQDRIVNSKRTSALMYHLKDFELYIVPNAGHMLMWEQPDLFNKYIEHFITDVVLNERSRA